MKPVEIKKGIYWVGIVDWSMRFFHGRTYTTRRGTTYNSYLIIDDKVTLVDGVYGPFANEWIENIKAIVPLEKIDYIVVNHIEPDHSRSLPVIAKLCPKARFFGTQKCKEGLFRQYYENWDFQVVKTGDKLKLGKRSLEFIEAAMIHWPDSMFTYCAEESLLLSNDAFGQHYATSERFDDQTDGCALQDEAIKYYANILWPFSSIILRKIEEIQKMNLKIDMIAPSHGVIWRREPKKILDNYIAWSKNESKPKIVVVYETMWGATDKMARKVVEGIVDQGVLVKLYDIAQADRTEVINDMFDSKGYIIGSSTYDNDMLPTIAGFLEFLKGMKPKNRIACAFGSYGWSGGATKEIEEALKAAGIEVTEPSLSIKYVPDEGEIKKCYEFGVNFAQKIKAKA